MHTHTHIYISSVVFHVQITIDFSEHALVNDGGGDVEDALAARHRRIERAGGLFKFW